MSQATERFRNHGVWQAMAAVGPVLDQAQGREGIDAASLDAIARMRTVLTFVGKRLAGADGDLVHPAPLDSLTGALNGMLNETNAFFSNGNPGHLTNANANADAALTYLAQINVPFTTEEYVGIKEAAEAYRRGMESALASIQAVVAQVNADAGSTHTALSQLAAEVSAEKQRLSSLASEQQGQFSSAQESRTRDAAAQLKEQQDKFVGLVAEHTQAFSAKTSEFGAMLEAAQRQHSDRLESLSKEFVGGAERLREELLTRKKEVEKLVGVIGNLGVTSGYQKAAKSARFATRFWQGVTLCAMVSFTGIALYAFLPVLGGGFTWTGFAGRVFISFTVGVLAAYAASQADKYQKVERRNEKMALELEALGPFLAPLPADKQETFRLTIGDRSFGHDDGLSSKGDSSPATLADLIGTKALRELIVEVVKAAK